MKYINRALADQILDRAETLREQALPLGSLVSEAVLHVRNVEAQVVWSVRDTWSAAQRRHVTEADVTEAVRTASDERLLELGCGAPKIGDYRSAQRRVARRREEQAAHAARSGNWNALANGVTATLKQHFPDAKSVTYAPIDRTRTLVEVADDIAVEEGALAAIEIRTDGSAPADGLSHAEVTERVSAQIDRLLDARVGALHDNLAAIQSGRHDLELLSDEAQEPPHDSDYLGGWVAQALGQASSGALSMLLLMLGKPAVMAALAPHIAQLPAGLPAAERGKRLAEIKGRLDVLYRHEAGLLLDDDGNLLLDVIPRRGIKAEYLILTEAA